MSSGGLCVACPGVGCHSAEIQPVEFLAKNHSAVLGWGGGEWKHGTGFLEGGFFSVFKF